MRLAVFLCLTSSTDNLPFIIFIFLVFCFSVRSIFSWNYAWISSFSLDFNLFFLFFFSFHIHFLTTGKKKKVDEEKLPMRLLLKVSFQIHKHKHCLREWTWRFDETEWKSNDIYYLEKLMWMDGNRARRNLKKKE